MPSNNSAELTPAQIKKNRASVMSKINQQNHMSQGFRLVNAKDYQQKIQQLKQKIASFEYSDDANKAQDQSIIDIMTGPASIDNYLDEKTKATMQAGAHTNASRSQVANTQLKRKQLFMMFFETIEAQEALKTYADKIASACNGKVKQPPGAYYGVKDFHGALDKITNRKRNYDIGDLKDAARMTIIFDNMEDMVNAKAAISLTLEFTQLQHFQTAMKDRYKTSQGADSRFNCDATDAGYKDIKFFLKMANGNIGELQLNTKNMMVAKKNGHIIYDILRDGGALDKPFTITNTEVIKKVAKNMGDNWFSFIKNRVPSASISLVEVKKIVARLNGNISRGNLSLAVDLKDIRALSSVSLSIYEQGDNAQALLD
jgi:hypothetical protein